MKVALLSPIFIASITEQIVQEQLAYVDLTTYLFEDFNEVNKIVEEIQPQYDGIVFAGILSYYVAKNKVKEETYWEYFPLHESCLLNVLFKAQHFYGKIKSISIDTYNLYNIQQIYKVAGLSLDEVEVKLLDLDLVNADSFNQRALEFHKENLKNNPNTCIITALSRVHEILNHENIINYMARPTESVIKDTFQKLYLKHTAKVNKNSQVVSVFIGIDLPSEYSLISKN